MHVQGNPQASWKFEDTIHDKNDYKCIVSS